MTASFIFSSFQIVINNYFTFFVSLRLVSCLLSHCFVYIFLYQSPYKLPVSLQRRIREEFQELQEEKKVLAPNILNIKSIDPESREVGEIVIIFMKEHCFLFVLDFHLNTMK